MKAIIATFILTLVFYGRLSADADSRQFELRGFNEVAKCIGVDPSIFDGPGCLSKYFNKLIPVGTSQEEAIKLLQTKFSKGSCSLSCEWRLDRNPMRVSITYKEGHRGIGISIMIALDTTNKTVVDVWTGEFSF